MRMKEFSIRHYGPLPDTKRTRLRNFNLIFGKNETGKTLLIDALVKILFKQNRKIFKRIDRVDAEPDGYVIIEDDKGKKIELPQKGDLTEICGLSPSECRNLFIIRNSDLSIARESKFYTDVTDSLTGLRTEEISSIKGKLQEIGKLTRADSGASLSDDSKWGKMKTKVKSARELIGNIRSLEREIKEENFDQMEEELIGITEVISEIEQKLCELEESRKREKYEKGDNALRKLEAASENLKGLNLAEIERLKSKLNNYEGNREYLSSQEPKNKFFGISAIISVVLLLVSILGFIIRPLSFLFYLTILFIVSTAILGLSKFYFVIKKVQLATTLKEIKSDASQLRVGGENIEDIRSNIKRVDENLTSRKEAEIRLDSYFGKKSGNFGENLSYWRLEIGTLEEYRNKAKEVEYDENRVSQLNSKKNKHSQEKEELRKKMQGFSDKLKAVERKANEILQLEEDHLPCETSLDLRTIKGRLGIFIEKIEKNKRDVLRVMKIFEEIEKEEEEKVSQLFGKDSPVSKYFCEITSGIYQEVKFVPDEKTIKTKLKNAEILDAEKLSGGAYDQLYLSIRLALGERLLKGSKGFFIMDDPFIKADMERLRKQMDILKGISEAGWQIMYLTAKDEVKDVLKTDIKNNKVNYIEIPSIHF